MAGAGHDATDDAAHGEDVAAITDRLSRGLHGLANDAGRLEQLVADGATLDDDTHLALDQAHSNAAALLATLDRMGLG